MPLKHGYASPTNKHPLYWIWTSMKQRCNNINHKDYSDYGGRGITVCKEWNERFTAFLDFAITNNWNHGLQLDRKDNDNGYFPDNCRFVRPKENSNNKRAMKKPKHNTSGFIGVCGDKNKYRAVVGINGKNKQVGSFTNKIDAAVARDVFVMDNNLNRTLNFEQPLTASILSAPLPGEEK